MEVLTWVCRVLFLFASPLGCWQWTAPHWLWIWLAVWHGCAEVVERPTSAWPSCGSSSSPPAPTCAGSGPSTRPSSERILLWPHTHCLLLLHPITQDVCSSLCAGQTAPSTLWLSSSSSWPRWWLALSRLLAFQVGECGKNFQWIVNSKRDN